MSSFSTDCISTLPPSLLANITACQTLSTTPFCYPPNNTRICVSNTTTTEFPFFFPRAFYGNDSKISLAYTLGTTYTPRLNNTGNTSLLVGESLYSIFGLNVPGVRNEKTLAVYMRAQRPGEGSEVEAYAGPTVVLVKTGEFASATATARPSVDDDDEDALTGLTSGGMAGVIVGVIVGIVALVTLCCFCGCCGCCGGKKRAGRVVGAEETDRVVKEGTELVEQGGAKSGVGPIQISAPVVVGATQDEITRVEEERARVDEEVVRDYIDPPPGYKP